MMTDRLEARYEDRVVGVFTRDGHSARFEYDDRWRHGVDAFPISVSMPLSQGRTEGDGVVAYLDGLLPDNVGVRRSWGRTYHVSSQSPFGLLRYVGRDVAGALQYVDPDSDAPVDQADDNHLTEEALARFVRRGREESATWGIPGSGGRFSLAGQQAKMAVCRVGDEWFAPSRERPSTHILKPGLVDYEDSALAEHLTMQLAGAVGLSVAPTAIVQFEDVVALAVTRFDRQRDDKGAVQRIHQEDFCQALGVPPTRRYQNEGGPGVLDMANVLSRALRARDSVSAKRVLLDAVAFNWLTLGTDAHAKNYSLQHTPTRTSFAPLYDLMSAAPYPKQLNPRSSSTKLAQAIGGEYRFRYVSADQWATTARGLGRRPRDVIDRVEELGHLVSARAAEVAEAHGTANPAFADRWQSSVITWADSARRLSSP